MTILDLLVGTANKKKGNKYHISLVFLHQQSNSKGTVYQTNQILSNIVYQMLFSRIEIRITLFGYST